MGLLDWVGEALAGVDTEAQEEALAEMETKLETARELVADTGVTQAQAAQIAGFGAGQAGGGGSAGEAEGFIHGAMSPFTGLGNFFANIGAAVGSAFDMEGVGSADPGSIAANAEDMVKASAEAVKSAMPSIMKYAAVAALILLVAGVALRIGRT